MNRTKIEWVKNPDGTQGYTWNPITGCLNGCPYCYARKLANGRLRQRYLDNHNVIPDYDALISALEDIEDPFYPRFWAERLRDPVQDISYAQSRRFGAQAKVKGIFVVDMGELFGDWIPREWQDKIFETIKDCPQHRFYLLTKQPQNLIKWSPFPENCWVGVTATDQKMFYEATKYLAQIEATIKYISVEPMFGRIFFPAWIGEVLNWLIIGVQTKPYKPPQIDEVEGAVNACDKAGIPVFLKDNLKPLARDSFGGIEFPLRQELPRLKERMEQEAQEEHHQSGFGRLKTKWKC